MILSKGHAEDHNDSYRAILHDSIVRAVAVSYHHPEKELDGYFGIGYLTDIPCFEGTRSTSPWYRSFQETCTQYR